MLITLINQILVMFILMALGFLANKLRLLHEESVSDLTQILLMIIGPALIITALQRPSTSDSLHTLLLVGFGVFLLYVIEIVLAQLFFGKVKDRDSRRSAIFSSVYNNVGFIGIPLVTALFGLDGVFYAVTSMVVYNIFCWTHGIALFHKEKQPLSDSLRSIILNPNVLAIILGLMLFLTSTSLPKIVVTSLTYLGNANTPLSMMVIGYTLADIRFSRQLLDKVVVLTVLCRNFLFSVFALFLFNWLSLKGIDYSASLLVAACPAPSMAVLFTLQVKGDTAYAAAEMGLSTALSLVSIPFLFFLASLLT